MCYIILIILNISSNEIIESIIYKLEKIKQFIRNKIKIQIKFIFTKEIFMQIIIYKKLKFIKCLD